MSHANALSLYHLLTIAHQDFLRKHPKTKKRHLHQYLEGGALSAKHLQEFLDQSYQLDRNESIDDFALDKQLSTPTTAVYYNPKTNHAVVAHRGTQGALDWGNNAIYAVAGRAGYRQTKRYKDALKVQKDAEAKYGPQNIETIGHSQAGLIAEEAGKDSKSIITVNKATSPFDPYATQNKNQVDVRSGTDPVSIWRPFFTSGSQSYNILPESINPLTEHSHKILNRVNPSKMFGF